MFTGIIEDVGQIVEIEDAGAFRRVHIQAPAVRKGLKAGSSISTNGVCITALETTADGFTADLSRETLQRTTFQHAGIGDRVNLERPMRPDDRFGGHIVQGHVDTFGHVRRFDRTRDDWTLEIDYPAPFAERLVWKGSIAVDGVSLTIADLSESTFSIAIIPYTLEHTNLSDRKPGDAVNLEFDVLAKYVGKLVAPYLDRISKELG